MARDGELHVRGEQRATHRVHAVQYAIGYSDGVGALALRNGKCDGRPQGRIAGRGVADVLRGLLAAVLDPGDVTQKHRAAIGYANSHATHVIGAREERAGLQNELPVRGGETAGRQAAVGHAECAGDVRGREMIAGQPSFVEIHAHLPALPADDGDGGNLVYLLDGIVQLRGEAPQIVIAVALAPERQG